MTHILKNRPAAAVLAGALALGALLGGSAPAQAKAAPLPRVSAFTLNVEFSLSTAQAVTDASRAMSLGSVGGFQEFSGPRDRSALVDAVASRGWEIYMPRGEGVTIPIVWDARRFSLIDANSVEVHPAEEGVTPARFINYVRLRDRASGDVTGFVNTHTIASASRDAQATDPQRVPRLRKHIAMLRGVIQSLAATTANVISVGDLNLNYLADRRRKLPGFPTATLGDLVSFDMPLTGSRGAKSLLDYVMSIKDAGGLAPQSSRIVGGFNSDHDAVVVSYQPLRLFTARRLSNQPSGERAQRRVVLDRMLRAVQGTESGAVVRLATGRVGSEMATALTAARARGVTLAVKARKNLKGTRLTVSQTGGAHYIVLVASRWLTPALVSKPSQLRILTRPAKYRAYAGAIDALR